MPIKRLQLNLIHDACGTPSMYSEKSDPLRSCQTAQNVEAALARVRQPLKRVGSRDRTQSLLTNKFVHPFYFGKNESHVGNEFFLAGFFHARTSRIKSILSRVSIQVITSSIGGAPFQCWIPHDLN
ncbi:hypothetical protein FPZ54_01275 [Sphingomonas suaedae]|uniref:Uncharacterized protein n=1 Tax=Sphingomonas suaedae TaxID=2599297 RepID=A0A518RBG4_9SPHN|nr:hypothetical protein [Sphingomonas suaedae]QDX24797.1 hypothetical protein FPZ54_01275 [Sphingomonas suaedae]